MKLLAAITLAFAFVMSSKADPGSVRVLVWDERQPEQAQAYEHFLGNAIAEHLKKQPGFSVTSVGLDDPQQGLDPVTLDAIDVLVWWGHRRQLDVNQGAVRGIVERIKAGTLSLIALHSAHWSQPFMEAMNARAIDDAMKVIPEGERATVKLDLVRPKPFTVPKRDEPLTPALSKIQNADGTAAWRLILPGCIFPAYRNDGKPSHLRTLLPEHPIARGIPATWDLPQTEMYDEPFHVPVPDTVLFEEKWDAGERFRSGCIWQVGKGRVFYFRPGHETYPIYRQELPLKIIENAARWLGTSSE
ncbi:MAG TPA: ThuA domain-containing protein [Chthoniobacteraceae bacterium]|nr:ThuA domain-containing protein [Chthoniobacteraceae bacterium]